MPCTMVAPITTSTIGSSKLVWCLPITSSKKYLGEKGRARPATRLMDINKSPRSMMPLRGRRSAQISGRAFHVSVADFLGLPAGVAGAVSSQQRGEHFVGAKRVGVSGNFGTIV